jgi:hypothetical protein
MNKKKTIIVVGLLVLVVTALILIFQKEIKTKESLNPLSLIPSNAVFVYENFKLPAAETDSADASLKLVSNLYSLIYFDDFLSKVMKIDSIYAEGSLNATLNLSSKSFAALFVNDKNVSDYLILLEVNKEGKKLLKELKEKFDHKDIFFQERSFRDQTIREYKFKKLNLTLSLTFIEDILVFSFDPVLIEDVIRKYEDDPKVHYEKQSIASSEIAGITGGSLYLNYDALTRFLKSFSQDSVSDLFNPIKHFASRAVFDISLRNDEILFNGITSLSTENENFLKVFTVQKPSSFDVKDLIPNQTSSLLFFGFNDGAALKQSLHRHWMRYDTLRASTLQVLSEVHDIDYYYKNLAGSLGICYLETADPTVSDKILYVKVNNVEQYIDKLQELNASDEEVYNPEIKKKMYVLNNEAFINTFFLGLSGPLGKCFYVQVDDFLVFSDNHVVLKKLLQDIEAENVWGKTSRYNNFLEETISESNILMLINLNASWRQFATYASDRSKKNMVTNHKIRDNDLIAVQMTEMEGGFYTSVLLHYDKTQRNIPQLASTSSNALFVSEHPIANQVFMASATEFVFQDLNSVLYLQNSSKNILIDSLDRLVGDNLIVADLNKDGKDNLLYLSSSKLMAKDKAGKDLPGFPVNFAEGYKLQSLSLLDYDNTKNYRICVSDQAGNVYLLDVKGNVLEGWNPKKFESRLAFPMVHQRVSSKDLIVGLQEKGVVQVVNRRGENYPGFPLALDGISKNPLFFEVKGDFSKTYIHALTDKGMFYKVDLNGKTIKKEQLIRQSSESHFRLCLDQKKNSYLIVRQTRNNVEVMDQNFKTLFEYKGCEGSNLTIQYFNFLQDKEFIVITDVAEKKLHVLDKQGRMLLPVGTDAEFQVQIKKDKEEKFTLYKVSGHKYEEVPLSVLK